MCTSNKQKIEENLIKKIEREFLPTPLHFLPAPLQFLKFQN